MNTDAWATQSDSTVTLTNRDSKIDEEGNEWYLTNVDEVKEILQFHFLV